jgi:phosphosulfolactate phosphohydrolase-like enzyme
MRWELEGLAGPVVVIDVIRAFTTAAYAFGAGAEAIYLVGSVDVPGESADRSLRSFSFR